jgi:mono/diheme cytochrome c family protein
MTTRASPRTIFFVAVLALVAAAAAVAQQQVSIRLPPEDATSQIRRGPGDELVRSRCALCHSLDYIVRQPRFSAAQWEAEVRKMVTAYGAPLTDADITAIADYLTRNYGPQAPPARPPAR